MTLATQVQAAIEKYCNTKFSATAVTQVFDGGFEDLIVKIGPIISITSITNNTDATVLASTKYAVDAKYGSIYLTTNSRWAKGRGKWTVVYQAGYATIPDDIQLAIDMWVDYLTTNASGAVSSYKTGDDSETYYVIDNMPTQVKGLISKYKRYIVSH